MVKLPDGRFLVTERPGRLRIIEDGKLVPDPVKGVPEVSQLLEGGLLDIKLHPDYADNGWIYLAFGKPGPGGAATSIVRAKLDGDSLTDVETIFDPPPADYSENHDHFGCRMIFDAENHLFFSIGDRGAWPNEKNPAQQLGRSTGKIHRVNDDGSIPTDNPFLETPGALPSLWSIGHRNPQGLSFQPGTDALWETEHGPAGGDELNIIRKGANYGWPLVSSGAVDRGPRFRFESEAPGLESPILAWRRTIAPSGTLFYKGEAFPEWNGNLFVCSLLQRKLIRIELDADNHISHMENLLQGLGRVRSIYNFADDGLFVIFDFPGVILRITPTT